MNLLNNHTHLKIDSYRHGKMEQWVKCFDNRELGFLAVYGQRKAFREHGIDGWGSKRLCFGVSTIRVEGVKQ